MRRLLLPLLLVLLSTPAALAQAPTAGVRAEAINQFDDLQNRFVQLAEAIPQEQYTWRPAEGVRSVSETFLHVAQANYFLLRSMGAEMPEGMGQDFQASTTDKEAILEYLRASFEDAKAAVTAMPDAATDEEVDWFGGAKLSKRGVLTFNVRHNAEHLGQLIAYARMNDITPPWSE